MSDAMDVSLEGDDEVVAQMSLRSFQVSVAETKRALSRCDSQLAAMVSRGETDGQRFGDLTNRREKLQDSLQEMESVEAQMRLRKKESR